jgi:hypothetical protein
MLHVFFGHEEKAEAGTTAFVRSVIAKASKPVALVPITRFATVDYPEGSNAFTFRRFLVPWMMRFEGVAVFVDGADMICRADICELLEERDPFLAVQVVKHEYRTRHQRKYVGTSMEADNADYERKQWASVMMMNCSHFGWRKVTPEFVRKARPLDLLQLRFLDDDRIGSLPIEWNWLADEHGANDAAKLVHYTAGIPMFEQHADAPMAGEWTAALLAASTCTAALPSLSTRKEAKP